YVTCVMGDGEPDVLARLLGDALARWPGYRGQRTASITTVMNAGIELDDRDAELELPSTNNRWLGGRGTSMSGGAAGVIASVSKAGDTATISFAKKMVSGLECSGGYKRTNRIIQIQNDGTLVYDSVCAGWRKTTYNGASRPQTVSARYAEHLVAGMIVSTIENVVALAWSKADTKTPALVIGIPVK
ncbi:MAG TPA: hypothetical protein VK427_07395, partial [Kofleriaceae bacterium]|nr:hypothetical protein [Kofleriaceae bacterium]